MRTPVIKQVAGLLTSQLYVVRGNSMQPSFEPGSLLLVNRMAYAGSVPYRGDVVIVGGTGDIGRRTLKRIVGLPGEEVRILEGLLYVEGDRAVEPYLGGLPAAPGLVDRTWRLHGGEYFVLGDNRVRSTDSRQYGPVGAGQILGKAWFRCWPPGQWGPVR
jgi:signal peptidase I